MGWEHDGFRSFYDVSWHPSRHGWTSRHDRREMARAEALASGLRRWMADVIAAVTP